MCRIELPVDGRGTTYVFVEWWISFNFSYNLRFHRADEHTSAQEECFGIPERSLVSHIALTLYFLTYIAVGFILF